MDAPIRSKAARSGRITRAIMMPDSLCSAKYFAIQPLWAQIPRSLRSPNHSLGNKREFRQTFTTNRPAATACVADAATFGPNGTYTGNVCVNRGRIGAWDHVNALGGSEEQSFRNTSGHTSRPCAAGRISSCCRSSACTGSFRLGSNSTAISACILSGSMITATTERSATRRRAC